MNTVTLESALRICFGERHARTNHRAELRRMARNLIAELRSRRQKDRGAL